jgi:hypothetical protein
MTFAPQAGNYHRPFLHDFLSRFIAERNGPAAELVESLEGVNEVTVEGIASQFAIADDLYTGPLLQLRRFVNGAILDELESRVSEFARLVALPRLFQVIRA